VAAWIARAQWDVNWDVTPSEHPGLRLSAAVTRCQAQREQVRGIASVSGCFRPLASLAVIWTFGTVTQEVASSLRAAAAGSGQACLVGPAISL
jgi:hypothetical protein